MISTIGMISIINIIDTNVILIILLVFIIKSQQVWPCRQASLVSDAEMMCEGARCQY
jgi:hypothetical protein